ncbi:MAG: Fic family protein [Minisyncoccia bacterium]
MGLLLKVHEMVTRGDSSANPGRLRADLRAIKSKGRIIYTAPANDKLDVLLREFINWFNQVADDKDSSPIITAAICHFWFVWIHPFCDGNGRVSRLLTTFLLLKKRSEGIRYFALSDYYNSNKDSYYDALEQTNKCIPTTPAMNFHEDMSLWVSYFLSSYLEQMSKLKEVTNRILQLNIRIEHLRKSSLLTDSHNKVLSFLASRERASYEELVAHLDGVTRPRVNQILKPLRSAHILVEERIGKRLWFKLGSPEEDADTTVLKKSVKRKLKTRTVDSKKPSKEAAGGQIVLPIFE